MSIPNELLTQQDQRAAEPGQTLTLPAPAKLNLMLHILGRRADGYHELQTLFQFLDYGDELNFALRADGQIHLHTDILGVPHDSNLIVRAARQLQRASTPSGRSNPLSTAPLSTPPPSPTSPAIG